jgi:hypothetical protein
MEAGLRDKKTPAGMSRQGLCLGDRREAAGGRLRYRATDPNGNGVALSMFPAKSNQATAYYKLGH